MSLPLSVGFGGRTTAGENWGTCGSPNTREAMLKRHCACMKSREHPPQGPDTVNRAALRLPVRQVSTGCHTPETAFRRRPGAAAELACDGSAAAAGGQCRADSREASPDADN